MRQLKLAIVSFTPNGQYQAERLFEILQSQAEGSFSVSVTYKPEHLKEWCRCQFEMQDAILFIGALGIAVRTIAPFIQDKKTDPAVLVMDEKARHMISVLSGHLGGGNELAIQLSALVGAEPVITTASDVNGKIAIDVFAKKNQLYISDMQKAKRIAAMIVAKEPVSFQCAGNIEGQVPPELSADSERAKGRVMVSVCEEELDENSLLLVPKAFILGIGCKKGKTVQEIEQAVLTVLKEKKLSIQAVGELASIDLKAEEKGLLDFAKKYDIKTHFYTAEELKRVPGTFEESSFVSKVTGVDNVCERAAVCQAFKENKDADPKRDIILHKVKKEGVTIALVQRKWGVTFE